MRAAILEEFGKPLAVEEVELLPPAPNHVIVRTGASVFCVTDCMNQRGDLAKKLPTILGHAGVGVIEELGRDVGELEVGQRVVVPGTPECGRCYWCARGRPDQCADLFVPQPHVANRSNGEAVTSSNPTSANASTTQAAAFSHSSEGYARWSGGPGHEAMPVSGTRQGLSTFNPAGLDGTSEGTPGMAADDGKTRLGLPAGSSPQPSESTAPSSVEGRGMLTSLPPPHITPAAEARLLPARRLLLPKGAFIDCTLETAIDSTLPGMTTCITATDTFGVDGQVVLLERGTKLVGETRGQVQQGSARIFVLWSEARTPTGVVVPLDSPGADELGRSGLRGTVSRHFWERFGAAILISTIDGAVQSAVHGANRGGGAVIYNPSSSQDIMTEVLKSTVNIPPTVVKHNGDRIQVLVARDLDFRPVYDLRAASGR